MKYAKYLMLLMLLLGGLSVAKAQVSVGIGVGPVIVEQGYAEPVCQWGYYPYFPYDCVPYGYYTSDWFLDGFFIGVGPWYGYHWRGYGYNGWYRTHYGWHDHDRWDNDHARWGHSNGWGHTVEPRGGFSQPRYNHAPESHSPRFSGRNSAPEGQGWRVQGGNNSGFHGGNNGFHGGNSGGSHGSSGHR